MKSCCSRGKRSLALLCEKLEKNLQMLLRKQLCSENCFLLKILKFVSDDCGPKTFCSFERSTTFVNSHLGQNFFLRIAGRNMRTSWLSFFDLLFLWFEKTRSSNNVYWSQGVTKSRFLNYLSELGGRNLQMKVECRWNEVSNSDKRLILQRSGLLSDC